MKDEIKILKNIRKIYKESNNINMQLFVYTTKAVFRSYTDFTPVLYVSKAAKEKAKELGIDLTKMTWKNQNTFDPKRKVFHYEHCNPVKQLREAILNTDEEIEDILKRDIVCWVLKTEDQELTIHGYKDSRPGGWKKCYKDCGIEYIKNK
jgi:hypothetical protein